MEEEKGEFASFLLLDPVDSRIKVTEEPTGNLQLIDLSATPHVKMNINKYYDYYHKKLIVCKYLNTYK